MSGLERSVRNMAGKSASRLSTISLLQPFVDAEAPAVPLISRDAYVAETSARLELLTRELAATRAELSAMKAAFAALTSDTDHLRRLERFLDREQRAKADAAEETRRTVRDVKVRLDRIEAKEGRGDYHGYTTFEAVSRRLTELGDDREQWKQVLRDVRINAVLFCGTVVLWAAALVRYLA